MARAKLTDLVLSILFYLSFGPSTDNIIFNKFFFRKGQNENTRRRAMRSALQNLCQKHLVEKKLYPSGLCLLTLTEISRDVLAESNIGFLDFDTAWIHQPREGQEKHDILTGALARKIDADIPESVIFFERFLRSERALSANPKRMPSAKGKGFPDLRAQLPSGNAVDFEVIYGGVKRKNLLAKIRAFRHRLFFVTKTLEQLQSLVAVIADLVDSRLIEYSVLQRIHLSDREHVFKTNFHDTTWVTLGERNDWRTFGEILGL